MSVPGAGGSTAPAPNWANDPWSGTGGLPGVNGGATNALNPWMNFSNGQSAPTPQAPQGPGPNAPVIQPQTIDFSQLDPGYASIVYGQDATDQQGKKDWQQGTATADAALQNAAQRGEIVKNIPHGLQSDWAGLQQTGQLGMNANGSVPVLHNPGVAPETRNANSDEASQYAAFQQFVNSPQGKQAIADAGGNAYIAWSRQQSINAGVAPNTGYGSGTTAGSSPLGTAANGDYFNQTRGGTDWTNQFGAPISAPSSMGNYNPFAIYQGFQPSGTAMSGPAPGAGTPTPEPADRGPAMQPWRQQPWQPTGGFGPGPQEKESAWQTQEGQHAYVSNITTGGDNTDTGDEKWIFPTPPAAMVGDTLAPKLPHGLPPPAAFNPTATVGGGDTPGGNGQWDGSTQYGPQGTPVTSVNGMTLPFAQTQNIPTFNWQQFSQPNSSMINQYSQMPQQSQQALQSITGIANMLQGEGKSQFGVGNTAYDQAMQIYSAIAGGNQGLAAQAIGPQAEQIAQIGSGARSAIQNSGARGGQREQLLAGNTQQTAQQVADLIPELKQNALQQLASGGLAGATAGQAAQAQSAGLHGTVAGAYQQQGQFGAQEALAQQLGAGQLGLGATAQQIQQALGQAGINLQQILGTGQLGLENQQQQFQQGPQFQFLQQQATQGNQLANEYLQLQQQGLLGQQNAAKGQSTSSTVGEMAMLAAMFA